MAGIDEALNLGVLENAVIDQLTGLNDPEVETVKEPLEEKVKTEKIEKQETKEELEAKKEAVLKVAEEIESKTSSEEEDGTEQAEDKETPADSVYPALAEFLKEKGIISSDDEIKTEEAFVDVMKKTIEEARYANLTEVQKQYLEAIESGVDAETAKSSVMDIKQLSTLKVSDLEANVELRHSLIREDLKAQGWNQSRIEKQITRLVESNDDLEEAVLAKTNIVSSINSRLESAKENFKKEEEAHKANFEKQVAALKDAVYSSDKVFGTFKVDKILQEKVYKSMTTPVEYEEDGKPLNALAKDRKDNPVDFEKRLYYAYTLTDGFNNLDKLVRKAENKAAKKLKEAVQNMDVIRTGSGMGLFTPPASDIPDIVDV